MSDFSNFFEVQTKTAWGRTLSEFASFCTSPTILNHRPEPDEGRLDRPKHIPFVLDVGCGPGLLPALFASQGYTAFGLDTDLFLLSSLRRDSGQAFLFPNLAQADALILPFPSSSFDCVTATNVLFLLGDPPQALREWKRVLAPGGQLCLLNPSENLGLAAARDLADRRGLEGAARESLLNWAYNAETHFRWTENETRELLSQAGFWVEAAVLRVGPGFARFIRARFD